MRYVIGTQFLEGLAIGLALFLLLAWMTRRKV